MAINRSAILILLVLAFGSCKKEVKDFDASGSFEADEVIVSAFQTGLITSLPISEGQKLEAGKQAGTIDVDLQRAQKQQVEASIKALKQKTVTPDAQIQVTQKQLAAQQNQLETLRKERLRTVNLINADAAPRKQLDDIDAQISQTERQMAVTRQQLALYRSNANTQNRSILSEADPISKSAQQIQIQIERGNIINPITGTILTKYAEKGELATVGKPIYKIAALDTVYLRAFITGDQLPVVKLGQQVKVRVDDGKKAFKTYPGTISWISSESEFTPKTIQTKTERSNLVYAIKVRTPNDGYLKLGMYGEVVF